MGEGEVKPWRLYVLYDVPCIPLGWGLDGRLWWFRSGDDGISFWDDIPTDACREEFRAVLVVGCYRIFDELIVARERFVAAHQIRWSRDTHGRFSSEVRRSVRWFVWWAASVLPVDVILYLLGAMMADDEDAECARRIVLKM